MGVFEPCLEFPPRQAISCDHENTFSVLVGDVYHAEVVSTLRLTESLSGAVGRRPVLAGAVQNPLDLCLGHTVVVDVRRPVTGLT